MKPATFSPKVFVLGLSALALLAWQHPAHAFGPAKPHKTPAKNGPSVENRGKAKPPEEAAAAPRKTVLGGNAARPANQDKANTGAQDDGSSSSESGFGQTPNKTLGTDAQANGGQNPGTKDVIPSSPSGKPMNTNPTRAAAINPNGKAVAPPLSPAPALSEWEKYVIQVAQKYDFSEDQNSRAKSILRDLRQRAQQYSLTRAPDFEQLTRITDQKIRAEAQKKLSLPIDTLFEELKLRLENLPTLEQKHRADAKSPAPRTTPR